MAGRHCNGGDVEFRQQRLVTVPHAKYRRHRPTDRARHSGPEKHLLGKAHLRRMDWHDEFDGAACRLRCRRTTNARHSRWRSLPHQGAEDLHYMGRARYDRQYRASSASTNARCPIRIEGYLTVHRAQISGQCGRFAGPTQRSALCLAGA